MSSQSDRTSTPPSPAWSTMSRSLHPSVSAAARRASRSSCLVPENRVSLVEASTGWQSVGSAQSHTVPRAHAGISSCVSTTVGTEGTLTSAPPARARKAGEGRWLEEVCICHSSLSLYIRMYTHNSCGEGQGGGDGRQKKVRQPGYA
eukprot:1487157-Pleurochrysis_carterae.AAC.1